MRFLFGILFKDSKIQSKSGLGRLELEPSTLQLESSVLDQSCGIRILAMLRKEFVLLKIKLISVPGL